MPFSQQTLHPEPRLYLLRLLKRKLGVLSLTKKAKTSFSRTRKSDELSLPNSWRLRIIQSLKK